MMTDKSQQQNPLLTSRRQQISIPRSGLSRPAWLSKANKQLALLIRDCSGSMNGQKASDASAASQGLVQELAEPSNRNGFEVAVVDFADEAILEHDVTLATELVGHVCSIESRGGTDMASGFETATEILSRPQFNSEIYLRPVVVAFSDGCTIKRAETGELAGLLKQHADLVTVAFGSDADEAFLKTIASTPDHFYRCSNGKSLRAFFAAVGVTLSASLQRGQNATQVLSKVRFHQ